MSEVQVTSDAVTVYSGSAGMVEVGNVGAVDVKVAAGGCGTKVRPGQTVTFRTGGAAVTAVTYGATAGRVTVGVAGGSRFGAPPGVAESDVPGSDAWLARWAPFYEAMASGVVTRDPVSGAPTAVGVVWPDGTAGAWTGSPSRVLSADGEVDSWAITYVGRVTRTVTQPPFKRSSTGSLVERPPLVVS